MTYSLVRPCGLRRLAILAILAILALLASAAVALALTRALPVKTALAAPVRPATARQAQHPQGPQAVWRQTGTPGRLVVVRPHVVDVMTGGRLTSRVARTAGPLRVSQLTSYVPTTWLSTSGSVTRLSAAVALTAGTTLTSSGTTLQLAGGTDAGSAASIWVGRGTLNLDNVTVSSWDPGTRRPVSASAAGRPFIVVGSGGHLNSTNTTLSDLGAAASTPNAADHSGVVFTSGSTGSLTGTRLENNLVGLRLAGSTDVHLDGVTIADSHDDGLVLHDDRSTTLNAVNLVDNGRNGVAVSGGSSGRVLSSVSASGNGAFGMAVLEQSNVGITALSSFGNRAGGLRLTGCRACTVSWATLTGEPVGVLIDGGASQVTLDHPQIRGGGRGLVLKRGVSHVTLKDLFARAVGREAVVTYAAGTTIIGGHISGGRTGINAKATASIEGTSITGVVEGVHVAPAVVVRGTRLDVLATRSGITVDPGGQLVLTDSRVEAPEALRGQKLNPRDQFVLGTLRGRVILQGNNSFSVLPLAWLGEAGVLLVMIAVLLQMVQAVRLRWAGRRISQDAPQASIVGRAAPPRVQVPENSPGGGAD